NAEESWERASMGVIMRSEMHEEPIPPLKEAKTEEDGAKNFKPKYKAPFILQGGTTLEEPTNNINEESDLEEETKVVKEVEENMKFTNTITIETLFHLIYILFSFKLISNVSGEKNIFKFQTNEDYEILFFYVKKDKNYAEYVCNEDYELKLLPDFNLDLDVDKHPFFIYGTENFITFEVFDHILSLNTSDKEYKKGIIECRYDLSYFLRLTKDISEASNELNGYQFKCMLMTLKNLKVVENKNIIKFLQIITLGNMRKEIFNLTLGFFNNLMITCEFYYGNLILSEGHGNYFDVSLLNNNIPYKNLLINSYKVFRSLENILKSSCILNTLRLLFNELNIKSLILNDFLCDEIISDDFAPIILSMFDFYSVKISNFRIQNSLEFLYCILIGIKKDFEILELVNIKSYRLNLNFFLKERKPRVLVLCEVNLIEYSSLVDDFPDFYENLEFIDFRFVYLNSHWWNDFLQKANLNKIILYFDNSKSEKNFSDEFTKLKSRKNNILYLELKFNCYKITTDFCNSLLFFKNLKSLKLDRYIIDEDTGSYFYKAIECMKELEYLALCQLADITKPFDFLLNKFKIKSLFLQNISVDNDIILIQFLKSHIF
ncbi:hypothetical protein CWI39_2301p0010, partial [Hamiltosporidium magnivora]